MSAIKKTIAIVGATGIQGLSVAQTFLVHPNWHVRCLTRSPSSEKAQALATQGAELVRADLSDTDSLRKAFAGTQVIFLNTDFWEPYRRAVRSGTDSATSCKIGYDTEVKLGKNAIEAAAEVHTLERFIYSALGPMKAASAGKYPHSHHWETKAHLVDYLLNKKLAKKSSFIYIGCYLTNQFLYPKLQNDLGEYVLLLPAKKETRLPIVDTARSTGPFVKALVDEAPGTRLIAYDEYLSFEEIISTWSRVTGKQAKFVQMSIQEMQKTTGMPLEVLETPAFLGEFEFSAGIPDLIGPSELKSHVNMKTFEDSLRALDVEILLGSQNFS